MHIDPKKVAFIFPGQGSQQVGMGADLVKLFPVCKQVFEEVDDALEYKLSDIIFNGPQSELDLTANTQPAIMATSMALMRFIEQEGPIETFCSVVAGHSLGEYSALCAVGSISLSDTAKLLKIRGEAMQAAVPVGLGAMAAILGMKIFEIQKIVDQTGCWIANDNIDGQVVISGSKEAVMKAIDLAREAGSKRAVPLPVSAPFHCPMMQPAADAMQEALANVEIKAPRLPIVPNVSALQTSKPEEIREFLVKQVTGMVRWRESSRYIQKLGALHFVEVGYGKVLTNIAKRLETGTMPICLFDAKSVKDFLS